MLIPRRSGVGFLTYAEFVKDHQEHSHCVGCGGCLADPSALARHSNFVWCVSCRDMLKANLPTNVQPPWMWQRVG